MIPLGTSFDLQQIVTQEMTADKIGSGLLPVLGTPFLVAMMENAAMQCLQPYLEEGQGSVGTFMETSHDSPTPIGMKVNVSVEVSNSYAQGKMVEFSIRAFDEGGIIAKATHIRAIVDNEKFLSKCTAKLK